MKTLTEAASFMTSVGSSGTQTPPQDCSHPCFGLLCPNDLVSRMQMFCCPPSLFMLLVTSHTLTYHICRNNIKAKGFINYWVSLGKAERVTPAGLHLSWMPAIISLISYIFSKSNFIFGNNNQSVMLNSQFWLVDNMMGRSHRIRFCI